MGKICVRSRVFGSGAQDISIWGYMRGDYAKDCGAHHFYMLAWPSICQYASEEMRIIRSLVSVHSMFFRLNLYHDGPKEHLWRLTRGLYYDRIMNDWPCNSSIGMAQMGPSVPMSTWPDEKKRALCPTGSLGQMNNENSWWMKIRLSGNMVSIVKVWLVLSLNLVLWLYLIVDYWFNFLSKFNGLFYYTVKFLMFSIWLSLFYFLLLLTTSLFSNWQLLIGVWFFFFIYSLLLFIFFFFSLPSLSLSLSLSLREQPIIFQNLMKILWH